MNKKVEVKAFNNNYKGFPIVVNHHEIGFLDCNNFINFFNGYEHYKADRKVMFSILKKSGTKFEKVSDKCHNLLNQLKENYRELQYLENDDDFIVTNDKNLVLAKIDKDSKSITWCDHSFNMDTKITICSHYLFEEFDFFPKSQAYQGVLSYIYAYTKDIDYVKIFQNNQLNLAEEILIRKILDSNFSIDEADLANSYITAGNFKKAVAMIDALDNNLSPDDLDNLDDTLEVEDGLKYE